MTLASRLLDWSGKKNSESAAELYFKSVGRFQTTIEDHDVNVLLQLLGVERVTTLLSGKTISAGSKRTLAALNPSVGIKPESSKKIAVCLSGDVRSFSSCKEKIARFFEGHEVLFFCHLWEDDASAGLLSDLDGFKLTQEERPDFTEMEYQSIKAFGFKVYKKDKKIPFMSPNLFPMWYGVLRSFQSIAEKGYSLDDFDLICRCRYDNYFLGQLGQFHGEFDDDMLVIDSNYNGYGGYGDQFAIGTPKAISKYCSLFYWFEEAFDIFNGSDRFFPEVVIKEYLESLNIAVKQVNFGLRLLRKEFIGLSDHKIPLRSHHTSKSRNDAISDYIKLKFPDLYNA